MNASEYIKELKKGTYDFNHFMYFATNGSSVSDHNRPI